MCGSFTYPSVFVCHVLTPLCVCVWHKFYIQTCVTWLTYAIDPLRLSHTGLRVSRIDSCRVIRRSHELYTQMCATWLINAIDAQRLAHTGLHLQGLHTPGALRCRQIRLAGADSIWRCPFHYHRQARRFFFLILGMRWPYSKIPISSGTHFIIFDKPAGVIRFFAFQCLTCEDSIWKCIFHQLFWCVVCVSVCLCVCVGECVCVCACVCVVGRGLRPVWLFWSRTCTHTHTHTQHTHTTHTHIHTYIHTHIHTHTHHAREIGSRPDSKTYLYIHVYVYVYMYIYIYIYMYTWI